MIKLVASDLDGTIIDKNNTIFENNLKAIDDLNKSHTNFVVCTGKTYSITKDLCSKLNATYGIFGNGSQIVNLKTGKELYKKVLSTSDVVTCIDIAKKYNLHTHLYTDKAVISEELLYLDLRNYMLQTNTKSEHCMKFKIVDDIKDYVLNNKCDVCKLVISSIHPISNVQAEITNSVNVSSCIIKKTGKYKDFIINKEYEYIDIKPIGVDKSIALNILGNYLKIKPEEILAVGDNLNDLNMIKNSGIGVAVANAYDEVKKVAKYTTSTPVEKGAFAEAVYKFIEF